MEPEVEEAEEIICYGGIVFPVLSAERDEEENCG